MIEACRDYLLARQARIGKEHEELIARFLKDWKPPFRWRWWSLPPLAPTREEAIEALKTRFKDWWGSPWSDIENRGSETAKRVESLKALAEITNRSADEYLTLTASDAALIRKYMP